MTGGTSTAGVRGHPNRVGVVSLWHETNTYSARTTSLEAFEQFELLQGGAIVEQHAGTGTVIGGMLDEAAFEHVPLLAAGAWPGGTVEQAALDELFARLESELLAAGALQGVLVNFHGAMVAESCDDVEHEAMRLIRQRVGDIPVAAVLDLHGNPSAAMVDLCDAVIAYQTYPHVDMRERGREAAALMAGMLDGRRLKSVVAKLDLLSCPLAQCTDEAPMSDLQALAAELERRRGVRISLLPGFPYSDVARAGFSVVVTGAPDRVKEASEVAESVLGAVSERAHEFELQRSDARTAVARAIASPRHPVILVDVADNIGGGGPGDGTAILEQLIAQGADSAIVTIADADVARAALRLGPGAVFEGEVGGKADSLHGAPVAVAGRIMQVAEVQYRTQGSWMTGHSFSLGATALIRVDGVTVVVMEHAVPPFHPEQLPAAGVDPSAAAIIVVKGAVAWRAAYGHLAREVIEVDTPGICPVDPHTLPRLADTGALGTQRVP